MKCYILLQMDSFLVNCSEILYFLLQFGFYQSDLYADRSGFDASTRMSPQKALASTMSRTNSSPGNFDSSIDRPMRLAEIFVAAEHALKQTISNPELGKSLSSSEEFEVSSRPDG